MAGLDVDSLLEHIGDFGSEHYEKLLELDKDIPKRGLLGESVLDALKMGENVADCQICQDDEKSPCAGVLLPCGHSFHYECAKHV